MHHDDAAPRTNGGERALGPGHGTQLGPVTVVGGAVVGGAVGAVVCGGPSEADRHRGPVPKGESAPMVSTLLLTRWSPIPGGLASTETPGVPEARPQHLGWWDRRTLPPSRPRRPGRSREASRREPWSKHFFGVKVGSPEVATVADAFPLWSVNASTTTGTHPAPRLMLPMVNRDRSSVERAGGRPMREGSVIFISELGQRRNGREHGTPPPPRQRERAALDREGAGWRGMTGTYGIVGIRRPNPEK